MPLLSLTLEERTHLFQETSFEGDRSVAWQADEYFDFAYRPKDPKVCLFSIDGRVVIERDFVCCELLGLTVYKRYIDSAITCIEMDYWHEKDPVLSRFLTLMIAIFAKETNDGVSFIAKTPHFTTFLFSLAFDAVDAIFTQATNAVLNKRIKLANVLDKYKRSATHHRTYSFFKQRNYSSFQQQHSNCQLSWPGGGQAISQTPDAELIEDGLKVTKPQH